jgi:hypothetical protein
MLVIDARQLNGKYQQIPNTTDAVISESAAKPELANKSIRVGQPIACAVAIASLNTVSAIAPP